MAEDNVNKTVVGTEIEFEGKIKSRETLEIHGKLSGEIQEAKLVKIAEKGIFKGKICSEELKIDGTLIGACDLGVLDVGDTGRCFIDNESIPPVMKLSYNCKLGNLSEAP